VPVAVALPEVPVTVMVYVPAVVEDSLQGVEVELELQADTPPARHTARSASASHAPQRRLRGTARSRIAASEAPPGMIHGFSRRPSLLDVHPPPPLVVMVNVAVPAPVPVMFAGVVEPKLSVGKSIAPTGSDVIAAASETLPVKPPVGVTVMLEVLPLVAPGSRPTGVPVMVNPPATAEVTMTEEEPLAGG